MITNTRLKSIKMTIAKAKNFTAAKLKV